MEIYKDTNTEASKEFEKLLKNEITKTKDLVEGKIIEGVITKITEKFVFLDCGLKSEPIIDVNELDKKESPRLKLASSILKKMGVKVKLMNDNIKIYGNPNLKINKKILINNYYKDHRIFMTSVIAAFTFGGKWKINDIDSYKSSFPSFLNVLKKLGFKFKLI